MKSYAALWPGITSFENLYEAFRRAPKASGLNAGRRNLSGR
jgi:hypothetical protein